VSVDLRRPYFVYGGLQDNGVWSGPSSSRSFRGGGNAEWRFLGGGDGMYVLADPEDPDTVYLETQFGALQRLDARAFESKGIRPPPPDEGQRERYNWCSPLLLSSHNSRVIYFGSQRLWKSLDRGERWKAVSGDLTTNDSEKVSGNVPHCTITTIGESPLDPDLLLVGTDDGNVQWSEDGGRNFTLLAGRFPGLPSRRWVSRVEPSRHDRLSAWVAFSGYREDDFAPYVYRTRDGGRTFARVTGGLPEGPVNVVRESPRRANVLFLGADGGAFFSLDGGDHWAPLSSGLPVVSVLDLAVHPREREVVLGTHGRGFFVVDVTSHEQLDAEVLASAAHLFEPGEAVLWRRTFGLGGASWDGDRRYRGAEPPPGAALWYWLGEGAGKASLEILDAKGKVVRKLEGAEGAGLHSGAWDLRFDPPAEEARPQEPAKQGDKSGAPKDERKPARRRYEPAARTEPGGAQDSADLAETAAPGEEMQTELPFAQEATGRRRRGGRGGEPARPGLYTVRLRVGERALERELRVVPDPELPPPGRRF
jgi:hypothetical protein